MSMKVILHATVLLTDTKFTLPPGLGRSETHSNLPKSEIFYFSLHEQKGRNLPQGGFYVLARGMSSLMLRTKLILVIWG